MTITRDIVAWAKTRPTWQQRLLHHLAAGSQVDDALLVQLLDEVLQPSELGDAEPLDLVLPPADEESVALTSLSDAKGVNALVDGSTLDFGSAGLTVVYGDNGSGKSGYARLVKHLVGARHPATVLADVFEETPDEPAALLLYSVGGEKQQQKYPGPADPYLQRVAYYDEHCGDVYLSRKSTLTYRPSALVLLDQLITSCDRMRELLTVRATDNQAREVRLHLPEGTTASAFFATLGPTTTESAIAQAAQLPADIAEVHARSAAEVARLQATNAVQERARLEKLADAAARLADHLRSADDLLGAAPLAAMNADMQAVRAAIEAATLAATEQLDTQLVGVGGEAWRALWTAAREYSTSDAYPHDTFPVTHDTARCVLCQQRLAPDAAARLQAFDRYMTDTTQRRAAQAEAVVLGHRTAVGRARGDDPSVAEAVALLETDAPNLTGAIRSSLSEVTAVRDATAGWLSGVDGGPVKPVTLGGSINRLVQQHDAYLRAARAIDVGTFQQALSAARAQLAEVEGRMALADAVDSVRAEVARRRQLAAVRKAMDDVGTSQITSKASHLTRTYAGDVIKDRFTRETEQLRLRNVTMRDLGGRKGQLEQQPGLLGAKASSVPTMQVLSEGEQTALGLAGFFTEAEFNSSKSALVLDDPVTSLDHVRREHVARRLAELARDRQVIVFTHDVVFAGELLKNADKQGVDVTTRSVVRQGNVPGHVQPALPWKAKDFKARYADLDLRLTKMETERDSYTQEDWEELVASWAGRLSELWERAVSTEVLDEVYDRGTSEVRVLKFRIIAAVTSQDNDEFQAGYGACSKWARRHDKAPETNYVAPEVTQLRDELDRIRDWQARVKKYR